MPDTSQPPGVDRPELLPSIASPADLKELSIDDLPAVCEELAFRGFVLHGLAREGGAWTAILTSSAGAEAVTRARRHTNKIVLYLVGFFSGVDF